VKRIVDADGKPLKEFKSELLGTTGISADKFKLIKQGLFSVVNDPGGTGAMARLYDVRVAGKTGTSQVINMRDSKAGTPYQYRDHALFVAFAPYDNPEIALAVVVEHGEHGGSAAAPIAARIMRAWFDGKKPARKEPDRGARDAEEDTGSEAAPVPAKEPRMSEDATHD
jgi:penicillin-binding protein 2